MDWACLVVPIQYNKSGAAFAALAVAGGQVPQAPDEDKDTRHIDGY